MPLPLNITVFARGAGGVPTTTYLADLAGRAESYTHTITAAFGFESMQVSMHVSRDEALEWLSGGLMHAVVVTGPDGVTCWEGFIASIEATLGQEQRSISIASMSNQIRAKYTTATGTPGVIVPVFDATSISLYGTKELVLSQSYVASDIATLMANTQLAMSAYPVMAPSTSVMSGDIGDATLTMTCAGWYTTLDWLFAPYTVGATNPASWVTPDAYTKTLTTVFNATNAFFSTDYSDIGSTGTAADTKAIGDGVTYRQKIESMLTRGAFIGGASQRLTWGIYENRRWKVAVWAGNTPTVTTYQRYLGDGRVYDSYGSVVNPWDVRPDAMYQVVDLLDLVPVANAPDAAARFYVQRVTCTMRSGQIGVQLEPINSSALELRFPGWK